MPNKNTRLIIGSNKLFTYNNILTQFAYDHDIITYTYNEKLSLKANTKIVFKNIKQKLIVMIKNNYHLKYSVIHFLGLLVHLIYILGVI
jgi:hypothetical protein